MPCPIPERKEKICSPDPSKPWESYKENFERSLVFYKAIQDNCTGKELESEPCGCLDTFLELQKDPTKAVLKLEPAEREEFLNSWRKYLKNVSPKEGLGKIPDLIKDFFKIKTDNYEDYEQTIFDYYKKFLFGDVPVPAYDCKKKGNPHQGFLSRFIKSVMASERELRYSFNESEEVLQCPTPTESTALKNTEKSFQESCITFFQKPETFFEEHKHINYLYIQTQNWPFSEKKQRYIVTGRHLLENSFVQDVLVSDNIKDLHPRIVYHLWRDYPAIWSKIFAGKHDCGDFSDTLKEPGPENSFFKRKYGTPEREYTDKYPRYNITVKVGKDITYKVPMSNEQVEQRNQEMHAMYFGLSWLHAHTHDFPYRFYESGSENKLEAFRNMSSNDRAAAERFVTWAVGKKPEFINADSFIPFFEFLQERHKGGSKPIKTFNFKRTIKKRRPRHNRHRTTHHIRLHKKT